MSEGHGAGGPKSKTTWRTQCTHSLANRRLLVKMCPFVPALIPFQLRTFRPDLPTCGDQERVGEGSVPGHDVIVKGVNRPLPFLKIRLARSIDGIPSHARFHVQEAIALEPRRHGRHDKVVAAEQAMAPSHPGRRRVYVRKSPDDHAPQEDTAVSRFRLVRLVEVKPVFCAFCVRTRMLESVSSPTLVRTRTSSALLRRVSSEIVGDLTRPPCWQFSPFMKASAFTRKSRRTHNRGDPRKWFPQRSLRDATACRNPSDTRRRTCCP